MPHSINDMATAIINDLKANGLDAYRERFDYCVLVDMDATTRALVLVYETGEAQVEVVKYDADGEPYSDEVIDTPVMAHDTDTIARLIRSYR